MTQGIQLQTEQKKESETCEVIGNLVRRRGGMEKRELSPCGSVRNKVYKQRAYLNNKTTTKIEQEKTRMFTNLLKTKNKFKRPCPRQ